MHGVYVHILADTFGSLGVIASTLLITMFGWQRSDPLFSLIVACLIIYSVYPLLKRTSAVLLQRIPSEFERKYQNCFVRLTSIPGVEHYKEAHFWTHQSGHIVGTIHLLISSEANEQTILRQSLEVFRDCGVEDMTIQINK